MYFGFRYIDISMFRDDGSVYFTFPYEYINTNRFCVVHSPKYNLVLTPGLMYVSRV